mgnify:CR=1 FL=1
MVEPIVQFPIFPEVLACRSAHVIVPLLFSVVDPPVIVDGLIVHPAIVPPVDVMFPFEAT